MQASGLHRAHAQFVNRTPRHFEITPLSPSHPPEMFGPTGMALDPGMGQVHSAAEAQSVRKPSTTNIKEQSTQVEEEAASRPDSWSMHYDSTDQAPYAATGDDKMMTSTNLLYVPKDNPSHDLAFFLRTTGPTAPHRRPSKMHRSGRAMPAPQRALRFFGIGSKRPSAAKTGSESYKLVLRDEGRLLGDVVQQAALPNAVEQRKTSTGTKYLALQVQSRDPSTHLVEEAPASGADILDSRISISFADEMHSSEALDNWLYTMSKDNTSHPQPSPSRDSSTYEARNPKAIDVKDDSSAPIRPAASNPPRPQPDSAISSLADSYISDLGEHPAKRSFDTARALSSHPVRPSRQSPPLTALPKMPATSGDLALKLPSPKRGVEIKHPSPRRFASHPVLMQRASSISLTLHLKSVAESPGSPPPRSPLRLRRDPWTIGNSLASQVSDTGRTTPNVPPSIKFVTDGDSDRDLIRPTVITECSGPIKRPRSRGKNSIVHPAYPSSRKEREERIRARKLRDRTQITRTIDTIVDSSPSTPRHRLRKTRPQIQIPDLRPAPLVTRASSSASSSPSWKKVTDCTRTPVSPVPSLESPTNNGEKTGHTPISPTASTQNTGANIAISPVMLVAEEIPVPKAKSTPKPARLVLREGKGKGYAPRPRSASLPRNLIKRRSHIDGVQGVQKSGEQTPSNCYTSTLEMRDEDAPPLPSPPPNRALPPTPPASGSEKPYKTKTVESKKELPVLPAYEIPNKTTLSERVEQPAHIVTQLQRKNASSKEANQASRINARLEALEKQNALLSAALMAVLKTNGSLNAPPMGSAEPENAKHAPTWQSRIARRSAASHGASSSNGSALEMYMSTRRGSRHLQ